ncbi:cytochrome c3 family protein [uncultured Desulfovibrio sp.]|uniref:cytochrome c3 family protein n=1 Tax=uncultured Desulfovibrio sp. TaxID=167968 RepID=UPI0026337E9E|nr:cytochrome c3 family protein [uncultured Desulfovibrio sp.]
MRHTLFSLTGLLLLLSFTCLPPAGAQAAAVDELEATDSGAPTAIMMLPNGDKKAVGSMKPVVFNHLIHERKIEDCTVCHHTGDPQKCSDCHTLKGSEAGKYITLERAMHATDIAPRTDGPTPQSCVSCHEQQLKRRECAGCHSIAKPARDDRWCGVCHSVTPSMSAQQLRQAASGTLPDDERDELAARTVLEKRYATPLRPELLPSRISLDSLSDKFGPNYFNHRRHVASLMRRIQDDKLAAAFHKDPASLCTACHHNSPASATPPSCANCHAARIDPADPGTPTLKAAYHLQCMGCHDGMKVARPLKTSCASCHKPRTQEGQ